MNQPTLVIPVAGVDGAPHPAGAVRTHRQIEGIRVAKVPQILDRALSVNRLEDSTTLADKNAGAGSALGVGPGLQLEPPGFAAVWAQQADGLGAGCRPTDGQDHAA